MSNSNWYRPSGVRPTFKSKSYTYPWYDKDSGKQVAIDVCEVRLTPEEYSWCYETKDKMASAEWKETDYRKGVNPKAIFVGLISEVAIAKVFNLSVDGNYRERGDKVDFLVNGNIWDIKGAVSGFHMRNFLIYKDDQSRNHSANFKRKLGADFYFLSHLDEGETDIGSDKNIIKKDGFATVCVIGCIERERVEELPPVKARGKYSKHYNREVLYNNPHVTSMKTLYEKSCEVELIQKEI